jgi:hypothetical protein
MVIGGVLAPDKIVAYEAIVAPDLALQAQRSLLSKVIVAVYLFRQKGAK